MKLATDSDVPLEDASVGRLSKDLSNPQAWGLCVRPHKLFDLLPLPPLVCVAMS